MKVIRTSDVGRHGPLPTKRRRILEWVRTKISIGRFKPGEILPPRKWFRAKFDIADHPVQQTFAELEREGFVRSVPGHGTHVADHLPFENRYLLLLRARREDAGVNLFAPALRAATAQVESARGISFVVRELVDAESDSIDYAETLSEMNRQQFAGVIAQDVTLEDHGMDTFTNVNNVPIAYFGVKSVFAQGNRCIPFGLYDRAWERVVIGRHFAGLKARGCSRIAVFRSYFKGCAQRNVMDELAKENGLEIVRDGYHHMSMTEWDPRQFERWIDLFLRSDAGRSSDGIMLGDDNMLSPCISAMRRQLGSKAATRYAVSCHCNFPCPPMSALPVEFHGPDLVAAVNGLVDFAEDCHKGLRRPRLPHLVAI